MKKITGFILIFTILTTPLFLECQEADTTGFSFFGSLGFDYIKSDTASTLWFNFSLQPEVSLGYLGVGLNIPLRVNNHGEFRNQDWDSPGEWMSIIRYLRIGKRGTPLWAKAGILDNVTSGYGFIMDNYRNTIDENNRKTGLQIASDLNKGGAELLLSNIGNIEIIGGRGFIRPVKFFAPVPILSNIELGSSYFRDFSSDSSVSIFGLDAGLPIINMSFLEWQLYTHYGKIIGYGGGMGYGTRVDFTFPMKLVTLSAKFERRNLGGNFIPSYFGPFYERERNILVNELNAADSTVAGYFGSLNAVILGKLKICGSYAWTEKRESGIMNLTVDARKFMTSVPVAISYTKKGITTTSDIFDFDDKENVVWTLLLNPEILPHTFVHIEATRKFMEENGEFIPIDKFSAGVGYRL